jgi:hypothetical protein
MKNFFLVAPLALAMSGCADSPAGLQITDTYAVNAACAPVEGNARPIGTHNLAADASYILGLNVQSTVQFTPIIVNEVPVTTAGESAIFISGVEMSYEVLGENKFSIEDETSPHFAPVSGGGGGGSEGGGSSLTVKLLGAVAKETLKGKVGAAPVRVAVTVRVVGETASGSSVRSNEITYPIDFKNVGCPAGLIVDPNARPGPCGEPGGQETVPITCIPAPAQG